MKTSRGFTQPNRILSFLRFGSGVTLISAAAAMAFVAANNSSPLLSGKSDVKREAKLCSLQGLRQQFPETPPWRIRDVTRCGERGRRAGIDRRCCQWDYDNRAYPATSIGAAQQLAAANAAEGDRQARQAARMQTGRRSARGASPRMPSSRASRPAPLPA